MSAVDEMIKTAQAWIGFRSGTSMNFFNQWYADHGGGASYRNYHAWCDDFVSYCGYVSGNSGVVGIYPYCPSHRNFFVSKGVWFNRGAKTPQPGDIVLFDWGGDGVADHIGIVEWASNGQVGTIEGNTNSYPGEVARHTYSQSYSSIMGYGRPAYAAAPVDPPKPTHWDGKGLQYEGKDRVDTCLTIARKARPNAKHFLIAKSSNYADMATGLWRAGQLGAQCHYGGTETPLTLDGLFIGGANRFGTQGAFHDYQIKVAGAPKSNVCFVVDSASSAISVGGASYREGIPILFYQDHEDFYNAIKQYGKVEVIGGGVPKLPGETKRIAGANRYETNVKAAYEYYGDWSYINLCSGYDGQWPDGIAAAQMINNSPILFAEGGPTADAMYANRSKVHEIVWFGGLASISYQRRQDLIKALEW